MYEHSFKFHRYSYLGPQPEFFKPEETHEHYIIIGMEAGAFDYAVGKHTGSASFGDLVFVPPGFLFKRKSLGEITFHMLGFTSLNSNPFFDTLPIGKVTIRDVNRLSSTYSYLRNSWHEYGSQSNEKSLALHMLLDLLHLSQSEGRYIQKRKKRTDPLIQQATEYIHKHLFVDLRMKDIAENLGIVPSDLTRRFRLEYGGTPIEYATRLRLEEVKKLLLETNYTLEVIASLCGYENGSYLSRVFRAKIGINASDFRNNNQI